MARASAKLARPAYEPDADETEALAAAAVTLQSFARVENAEAVATAVISRWIIERMKRVAGQRMSDTVVFDLGGAKMRGAIEASLPHLAEALAGLPADVPFFELPKAQVVDVFMAGIAAARHASVGIAELNDEIPF